MLNLRTFSQTQLHINDYKSAFSLNENKEGSFIGLKDDEPRWDQKELWRSDNDYETHYIPIYEEYGVLDSSKYTKTETLVDTSIVIEKRKKLRPKEIQVKFVVPGLRKWSFLRGYDFGSSTVNSIAWTCEIETFYNAPINYSVFYVNADSTLKETVAHTPHSITFDNVNPDKDNSYILKMTNVDKLSNNTIFIKITSTKSIQERVIKYEKRDVGIKTIRVLKERDFLHLSVPIVHTLKPYGY